VRRIDASRRAAALAVFCAALMLSATATIAFAADAASAPAPRAIGYFLWDAEYLFIGAKVDDPNLTGSNNTAMSEPWRDDSVDVYLDMSGAAGDAVDESCARFVVSVASGFTCLVGTPAGTWRAQPSWLMGLKVAVEREGSLNNPRDTDVGYTVEIGIPWKFLGGTPQPERRIGFNFVVHVRGENEASVSWSSRAQSRDDFDRPAAWGSMALSPGAKPLVAENDILICPRTYRPPSVDGTLGAAEWLGASVIQLEKPVPELTPEVVSAGKPGARVLAAYRYDYQVLPAQSASGEFRPPSLVDQPPTGLGPWFSADSVDWHKGMLRQARQAAIDTVLPVYRGDPAARHDWSRLGLLRLVEALKETKDERLSYPLVGMYLDASCLPQAGATDLTTAAGKQTLWGMIAEFFDIVPDEFRAQFDFGAPVHSNLLVVGPPAGVDNWNAATFDYCRDAYRRAYGSTLTILADEAWRSKADNLDGYCALEPTSGLSYGKEGPHPTIRLTPGCVSPASIVPRHDGQTYEQGWTRALMALPDYVLVDSFNDYASGSEISDSRQFGVRFLDITRQSSQSLAGRRDYQVALRRDTLPPVLNPGATYQVELLVENQGFQDLVDRNNVEISYTLQNRSRANIKRTGVATPRLMVLAGQRAPILVEISTRLVEGPLPVGDYELSFEVTKSTIPFLRSRWFATRLFEISLPVRIDRAPPLRTTVLTTTLPTAMGAGASRRVRLRLRNDGSRSWNAREVALAYHWVRVPGPSAASAKPEVVEWAGARAPLPKNVAPGEMITMYATVQASMADGTPLPAWSPAEDWSYQLQWDLVEGKDKWFSRNGGGVYPETVAVTASDVGATVVNADAPDRMEAGKTYPIKALVRNDGSTVWDPAHVHISYQWHYWDGSEAVQHGAAGDLQAPVAPGGSALVTAQVAAPDAAGSYRLAWDMMIDDRHASTILDAGGRHLFVQPVIIAGGAYEPVDLSKFLNVFAATYDGYRGRGGFDIGAFSFPAEYLPPDTAAVKIDDYPAIYYVAGESANSLARVPLRYPPSDQRGGAAVACDGQPVPLPEGPVSALYIAASASAAVDAEFQLGYADGSVERAAVRVPSWVDPAPDTVVAVRAPFIRGTQDDILKPAAIYLFRIGDLARQDAPTALVLPVLPQLKIFAVTVERSSAGGGS
jgi:hypothetical protein